MIVQNKAYIYISNEIILQMHTTKTKHIATDHKP